MQRTRSGSNGPMPVYWQGASYRQLAMDKSGSWGEALDIAVGANGLIASGTRGNQQGQ